MMELFISIKLLSLKNQDKYQSPKAIPFLMSQGKKFKVKCPRKLLAKDLIPQ